MEMKRRKRKEQGHGDFTKYKTTSKNQTIKIKFSVFKLSQGVRQLSIDQNASVDSRIRFVQFMQCGNLG
jgi:hypothetical protein